MIVKKVRGSSLKPRSGEINLSCLLYSFTLFTQAISGVIQCSTNFGVAVGLRLFTPGSASYTLGYLRLTTSWLVD